MNLTDVLTFAGGGALAVVAILLLRPRQPSSPRHTPPARHATPSAPADGSSSAAIRELIEAGRKIEAIRAYRQAYGVGLKEAKEAVEAMQRELP